MNKYKAILFDFDGTIIDTNQYIIDSWQYMAKRVLGDRLFDVDYLASTFGTPLYDSMVEAKEKYGVEDYSAEEMCEIYREYQTNYRDRIGTPFEGVCELIETLHKEGFILGIVTSRGNADTRNALEGFGLDKYFDYIVGMDDTTIHKPFPEPCLICCEKLGVLPSEALMIGDSHFDTECANNAGADSAFAAWSFCTDVSKLTGNAKPDYIINKALELLEVVRG